MFFQNLNFCCFVHLEEPEEKTFKASPGLHNLFSIEMLFFFKIRIKPWIFVAPKSFFADADLLAPNA
jgi:hypothetical protein